MTQKEKEAIEHQAKRSEILKKLLKSKPSKNHKEEDTEEAVSSSCSDDNSSSGSNISEATAID